MKPDYRKAFMAKLFAHLDEGVKARKWCSRILRHTDAEKYDWCVFYAVACLYESGCCRALARRGYPIPSRKCGSTSVAGPASFLGWGEKLESMAPGTLLKINGRRDLADGDILVVPKDHVAIYHAGKFIGGNQGHPGKRSKVTHARRNLTGSEFAVRFLPLLEGRRGDR